MQSYSLGAAMVAALADSFCRESCFKCCCCMCWCYVSTKQLFHMLLMCAVDVAPESAVMPLLRGMLLQMLLLQIIVLVLCCCVACVAVLHVLLTCAVAEEARPV